MVLVKGPSGIGKSALIGSVQVALIAHNGVYVAGKHDVLRRHIPLSALSSAVDQLVRRILLEPPARFSVWQRRLQEALGASGQVLIDLVPALQLVVGEAAKAPTLPPAEAENRLMFQLDRLLRALCVEQPLVLFLDDLQWADVATLKFLGRWCRDKAANAGMMLIGAYRSDEVLAGHPLLDACDKLEKRGEAPCVITLAAMSQEDIDELLRDSTGRDDTQALAALLLEKTAGNAFFVREYLRSLAQAGHLRRDEQRRWTWDLEAIRRASGTRNVLEFMLNELASLTQSEDRRVLGVAAFLGNAFSVAMLSRAANLSQHETLAALKAAGDAGLIIPVGREWRYAQHTGIDVNFQFVHDKVHEAARSLLSGDALVQAHYTVGKQLLATVPREGVTEATFLAANHLNEARSLLSAQERADLADLNRRAAEEAQRATAFDVAAEYWEQALKEWGPQDPQGRHARMQAAHCEFLIGKRDQAEDRLRALLADSTDVLEKVEIHRTRSKCLAASMRPVESIQEALQALALLGLKIPQKVKLRHVVFAMLRVRRARRGRRIDSLGSMPETQDARVRLKVAICSELTMQAFFTDTTLYAVTVASMGRLLIEQGLTGDSAFILGSLGMMTAIRGNYAFARQYCTAATEIMQRDPDLYSAGRLAVDCSVLHMSVHARDIIKAYFQGGMRGLAAGDVVNGTLSLGMAHNCLLLVNVDEHRESSLASDAMRRQLDRDYHEYTVCVRQAERCLRGETRASDSLSDAEFEEDTLRARIARHEVGNIAPLSYYLARTMIACVHRHFEQGIEAAYAGLKADMLHRMGEHNAFTFDFFFGVMLAEEALSRGGRTRHNKQLRRIQNRFRNMCGGDAFIAEGASKLIDASLLAMSNDAQAGRLYEEATRLLDRSGYNSYAGVAHECAARYYFRIGLDTTAQLHLRAALNFFRLLGAQRKMGLLKSEFGAALEPALQGIQEIHLASTMHAGDFSDHLDVPGLMRATQALSSEVTVDKLVARVVSVAQEVAGATRAALLLADSAGQMVCQADSAEKPQELPHDVLQYVTRSQEVVVDDDPAAVPQWKKDAYLQQTRPRSILCVPLILQGTLHGLIYMENALTAKMFTRDRVELVKMLVVQAAVSLQNARLYNELEKEVAERTGELRQAHERLLQAERDNAEMRMAGGFAHEMFNALSGARYILDQVLDLRGGVDGTWNELRRLVQGTKLTPVEQRSSTELFAYVADCLRNVSSAVSRGIAVTSRILEYAEVSKLLPGTESLHLDDVVHSVIAKLKNPADQDAIQYVVQMPHQLSVLANRDHLALILNHLLANARDAVLVRENAADRVVRVGCEQKPGQISLTVEDTGKGLNKEARAHLFDPFFSTKGSAGVGLGLGLSRKVARLYGGDLECDETTGTGARFRLTLPPTA